MRVKDDQRHLLQFRQGDALPIARQQHGDLRLGERGHGQGGSRWGCRILPQRVAGDAGSAVQFVAALLDIGLRENARQTRARSWRQRQHQQLAGAKIQRVVAGAALREGHGRRQQGVGHRACSFVAAGRRWRRLPGCQRVAVDEPARVGAQAEAASRVALGAAVHKREAHQAGDGHGQWLGHDDNAAVEVADVVVERVEGATAGIADRQRIR